MKKRDFIIILSILIFSVIIYIVFNSGKTQGTGVIVTIDGVEVARYSFEEEGEYELNNGSNILVIKDNCAWIKSANCKNNDCVKQGKISYEGKKITCLPNKLVVQVYGTDNWVDIE